MKKTLKVSIGGLAFIIEEGAYQILDNYLGTLRDFYHNREDGAEIIADVEARMSELLQMKINTSQGVVTVHEAEDIIGIMGNPKDFDDETAETANSEQSDKPEEQTPNYRKRLYRDPAHGMVAGVFSGIGYYFQTDPVIIRLGYIAVILLASIISNKYLWFGVLAYLIVWAVTPVAKTFKQKLSMIGKDPSIETVVSGNSGSYSYRPTASKVGSTLLQIIKITIASIMILIGVSFLIAAITLICSYLWYDYPVSASELLDIINLNSLDVKGSMILLLILPGLINIYLGIRILKGFSVRDVIIVGIVLFVWIASAFYIGSLSTKVLRNYKAQEEATEIIEVKTPSDTLLLKIDPKYVLAEPLFSAIGENVEPFIYRMETGGAKDYFILPRVYVYEDSTLVDYKLEVERVVFDRSRSFARKRLDAAKLNYTANDSLLTITPKTFSKNTGLEQEFYKLTIKTPKNKKVVIDPMLKGY